MSDLEAVAARVHDAWVAKQRSLGHTSRLSNLTGEEQMVPYDQLSEPVKEFDRMLVREVWAAGAGTNSDSFTRLHDEVARLTADRDAARAERDEACAGESERAQERDAALALLREVREWLEDQGWGHVGMQMRRAFRDRIDALLEKTP